MQGVGGSSSRYDAGESDRDFDSDGDPTAGEEDGQEEEEPTGVELMCVLGKTGEMSMSISKQELMLIAFTSHFRRWIALGGGATTLGMEEVPMNSPESILFINSS